MKIVVEPNLSFFRFSCCICDETFELNDEQPVAYQDSGERLGDLCSDCFAAAVECGGEGLARRLREKTVMARSWVEHADEMAGTALGLTAKGRDVMDAAAWMQTIGRDEAKAARLATETIEISDHARLAEFRAEWAPCCESTPDDPDCPF